MNNIDIHVESLSMRFRFLNEKIDSLKDFFIRKMKRKIQYSDFYALKSINFTIYQGERVGIIGHNGAGKSTLLKIISGVIKPTEGIVTVNGNIAPLLELGAGFDPELSGAENIYLNGALLGKSKEYLENKFEDIVSYSELGEFIHTPLKNYSSGMRARLGFSIATQVDPDILLVDEVLGVGDQNFRKKSSETMLNMMNSGKTVIVVSHTLGQIRKLTEKVIWLHQGEVREIGDTESVCAKYEEDLSKK